MFERSQRARVRDERRARSRRLGEVRQAPRREVRRRKGSAPFVALASRENRQQRAKHLRHRKHRVVVVNEQSYLRQEPQRASARDVRPGGDVRRERGEGNRIGSRAFAERWLRRPGRDRGSAARLDRTGRARVRPRGVDARERERAQPRERGAESSRVASVVGSVWQRRRVPTGPRSFARRLPRPRSAGPDRACGCGRAPRAARCEATRRAPHGARGRVARSGTEGGIERAVSSTPRSTSRDLPSLRNLS